MMKQNTAVRIVLIVAIALGVEAAALAVAAGAAPPPRCTVEQGQIYIDEGRYKHAVREFSCLVDAEPTAVEGYRGRIEALLLLGRYSDAVRDYARVTALVLPVHPDAASLILGGYTVRLAVAPHDIPALTGASFAHWWFFQYPAAIQVLNQLVGLDPDNLYGRTFRGSSRMLLGANRALGAADLEHALALAPTSADVRFIVADAYLYGAADYTRAFAEATQALAWGLDTPRVHAIVASAYLAFGQLQPAAVHIKRHIDLVTTQLVTTAPLVAGMLTLDLVPGRTGDIPIPVIAGETITLTTRSNDFGDTIAVLLAPNGQPVVGSDDARVYFAAIQWPAEVTGTYRLRVTSFEAVSTGELVVTRK